MTFLLDDSCYVNTQIESVLPKRYISSFRPSRDLHRYQCSCHQYVIENQKAKEAIELQNATESHLDGRTHLTPLRCNWPPCLLPCINCRCSRGPPSSTLCFKSWNLRTLHPLQIQLSSLNPHSFRPCLTQGTQKSGSLQPVTISRTSIRPLLAFSNLKPHTEP